MINWTQDQWVAFGGLVLAGCCALGLAALAIHAVRGWTAPAYSQGPRHAYRAELVTIAYDPARRVDFEYSPSSPAAIAATAPDPALRTSAEIAAELYAWTHAHLAEFDQRFAAITRAANTALAPAMLKAITWAIEGQLSGVSGAGRLMEWHTDTPTGEYPLVLPLSHDVRALAGALLLA